MAGQSLSESLVRMKALTETDIARVISRELGCPYLDASRYDIPPEILHLIPVDVAVECLILPLDRIGRSLLLACTGSVPAEILDAIARRSKLRVFLCIATPSQILEAIKRNGSRLLEAIRHDYETKTHAGAAGTA